MGDYDAFDGGSGDWGDDGGLFDEAQKRAAKGGGGRGRRGFWREVGLLARMARSVVAGDYELATPKVLLLIATLGYVVSPVDAVPDLIPVLGLADDAGVVAATIGALSYELVQYREWEITNEAA